MKCTVCTKEIEKSRYSHEILCSAECCAKDLWIRLSHRKDYFRIGNICYSLGSFDEVWKDHTGRISYIRLPDQTIVETSNLWCHGELSEEFLSNFEEAHTLYKYYVDAPRGIRDYEKAQRLWDFQDFYSRVDLIYVTDPQDEEEIIGMNFWYEDERDLTLIQELAKNI